MTGQPLRPEIATALLRVAAGLPPVLAVIDAHTIVWREAEKLFRRQYEDERAQADWIDLGGEAGA